MKFITDYFKSLTLKRVIVLFLGNIVLGLGIGIFKFAGMGNDPYSAMIFAVADFIHMPFPVFQILINIVFFVVFELTLGRKYIGLGTIVNMCLLGYIVNFFVNLLDLLFTRPAVFIVQLPIMLVGVIFTCLGISLYQSSDAGVASYDCISIIMAERINKLPYFWARMITDGLCALVCFLTGGLLGLGTLVCAFGLGPVTHFFNKTVSEPFFNAGADKTPA